MYTKLVTTAAGVAITLTSRVMNGELEIPQSTRQLIERARKRVDVLNHIVGNLDLTQPATWGRFVARILEMASDPDRRFDNTQQVRAWLNLESPVHMPALLLRHAMRTLEWSVIHQNESAVLELTRLVDGEVLLVQERELQGHDPPALYTNAAGHARLHELRACLLTGFWQGRPAVRLEKVGEHIMDRALPLEGFVYRGEALKLVEQWRQFLTLGIRRNILLQGDPGCGKTTLCHHAARELSERTLVLDASLLSDMNLGEWFELLEVTDPQVLIIDDIDREAHHFTSNLRLFEEGHCKVPLVLFTSNAYATLPSAMRRPGRIDQIVQLDEPCEQMRWEIIEEMARAVDVLIPSARKAWLLSLHEDYSAAHVLEALRRARILGWEETEREGDISFLLQRDFGSGYEWLRAHGYRSFDMENSFLGRHMLEFGQPRVCYRDLHEAYVEVELPNGAKLAIDDRDQNYLSVYARDRAQKWARTHEGIAQLLWGAHRGLLLDMGGNHDFSLRPMPLDAARYHGTMLSHIERWEAFRAHGLRRVVLCQGKPGSGKSTFCLHVARHLGARTLMLTPAAYDELSYAAWQELVEILKPQLIIVDDIDRVGHHTLEKNLRLFEEGHCEVPWVLFTSNDHEMLPLAMRRPGRIDEILEFTSPDGELMGDLMDELAARVGVTIPEHERERVSALMQEHSNAFAVELLRRAKVCGWDGLVFEGDMTFTSGQDLKE